MRSIKTLLRLMGAVALTTVAASSVVACGTNVKAPVLNGKYATLLGWYGSDNTTSNIGQKLEKNTTSGQEKVEIVADNTNIVSTSFATKLLNSENKALNEEAASFLAELGFKTGNKDKAYSAQEKDAINALKAKVKTSEAGKVETNETTDFKVSAGTCQISIMDKDEDGAKIVKEYTINTIKNDDLHVSTVVQSLVTLGNLDLTKANGFKAESNVLQVLPWKASKNVEQKYYQSLTNLFGEQTLIWSSSNDHGTTNIPKYTGSKVYLNIKFKNVLVISDLDCGTPT